MREILAAVDAELAALERRADKLREIRQRALELEDAWVAVASAAPATPTSAQVASETRAPVKAKAKRGPRQAPPLTAEEAVQAAGELLGDGPTTIGKILDALGRSRTPRAQDAIKEALDRLGAKVIGRGRGGASLYALTAAPQAAEEHAGEEGELLAKVRELDGHAVGWSDEEMRYQLGKRCGIDASIAEVQEARAKLNGAPA